MWIPPGVEVFSKLVSHDVDIVAPLFFVRRPPFLPLLFKQTFYGNGALMSYNNILDYPKDQLVECDGVGFGMILIKAEVFKRLKQPFFVYNDQYGEDLKFCTDAKASGARIFCDTSIKLGHFGDPPIVQEGHFNQSREAAELFLEQKKKDLTKHGEQMTLKADIVMPCYHNFDMTKRAIESILNNTDMVNYQLILINDGNDKDLAKYFKQLQKFRKNVKVITNDKPLGCIKGVNQALAISKAPYVMVIDNDTYIPDNMKEWLMRLITELAKDGELGAVAPVSNWVAGLQSMANDLKIQVPTHYAKFLIGAFTLFRRVALDKAMGGKLDEGFYPGYNVDLDFSIALRQAGYKLKVIRSVFIHHEGGKSIETTCKFEEENNRTRQILIDKWGADTVNEIFTMSEKFLLFGKD